MGSYIPTNEAERILWLGNFNTWVQANGTSHGLTAAELTELGALVSDADNAVNDNVAKQAVAKASTASKNNALGAATALSRDFAQRIQHDPNTTDGDRAEAGLTIPDHEPTKSDDEDILSVTPPAIELDFSQRQQITIHWGPNPQDERHNGKPEGVMGCEIQYHRGGLPATESEWTVLETDTESPLTHIVQENEPTTYAYRARYVSKHLKLGPHGNPAVCTISV